jgi:LacI family transcriptional regulator
LRKRSTETVGVVVPKLNSYFMATVIAGIEKITNKNGYGLIISQSQESVKQEVSCVSTLFNSRVDGMLISLAFDTKNLDHFTKLFNKDIPVVFFDRVADWHGCLSVIIDNYKAGYEATSHLIEQGCRRIVHLGGNILRNVYSDRLRGYRQALHDNRIDFNQNLVFISDLTSESGKTLMKKILKMNLKPDGIFAANDTTAVAAMIEIQAEGIRIPGDIAVVGFNNAPISEVIRPNLTTIDYPASEMGEIAAASLINKLRDIQSVNLSRIIMKHRLIVRESSLRSGKKIVKQ